ncbi:MAG TPA: hypothetical protein VN025_08845 [Candidatus Dormibacteraeota bacterium]|jgi:hypothetical protein|nr:hypothetical protein [Candidatus Dormibacteraeota bacterium]
MASLARQVRIFQENWRYVSLVAVCVTALLFGAVERGEAQHMLAPAPLAESSSPANAVRSAPSTIVIGFMGGMVKRNEPNRSEVQLAAKLREEYSNTAYVDTYENARWKEAEQTILKLLDTDKDGKLSEDEKRHARIILFGHSWGASATVTLAKALGDLGIPVLLTVQVDSVQKMGQKDDIIPANVQEALNFFQPDGILHGRKLIRAEDTSKTKILGNYEMNYKHTALVCQGYPWHQRVFAREHMDIECDPEVWTQIGSLIRSKLPQMQAQTQTLSQGK